MRLNRGALFAIEIAIVAAVVLVGFFSTFQAIASGIAQAWQWLVG